MFLYIFYFLPLALRIVSTPITAVKSIVASPSVSYPLKSKTTPVTRLALPVCCAAFSVYAVAILVAWVPNGSRVLVTSLKKYNSTSPHTITSNAAGLLACQDIDGALVGGASLKAADFAAIIKAAV